MSVTFSTSWSGSTPGILSSEFCFPRQRDFLSPVSNLTAKLQGDTLVNVALAARSLLSHRPSSNQTSPRGGLNQCKETEETSLEPNHERKRKWRRENGAALKTKRGLKIKLRMRKVGKAFFTQTGIHSFFQEEFIEHLFHVNHHAGSWKISKG